MKIILFTHPNFLGHQSMPRFANMINKGMKDRGHSVDIWSPKPVLVNLSKYNFFKKWFGYIDQYILFPREVRAKLNEVTNDTLFVFCDQALGPWVPLVKKRYHVIHCHDFLAQKSALGLIAENKTGFTGKIYQRLIQNGYSKGKNFISVSNKTKEDLSNFLESSPLSSHVVYNGLNRSFSPMNKEKVRKDLSLNFSLNLNQGYILHVGGNQWYKNREGIIEIYESWRFNFQSSLPLILIGEKPDEKLSKKRELSLFKDDIIFLVGVKDNLVDKFYAGASVFLFPSLAEGFGWPIAESMASGSLVITTDESPMNEVASDAGFYIDLKPHTKEKVKAWAEKSAKVLENTLQLSESQKKIAINKGIENAKRFDQDIAIDTIEKLYKQIIEQS